MFRGNAARTGYLDEQAYPPFVKAWEFQIQGDVVSSPVVYDGTVYVGANSGGVYALNARTGELLWDYSTDGWVEASPAVSSAAVFVPSMDGRLYALNRWNGDVLWSADLGAPSVSSPLYLDGKVYVGAGSPRNSLRAYDAFTGALLFEKRAAQPVDSAPSSDGAGVYFGSNDGRIYAVSRDSPVCPWPGSASYYQTMGGNFGKGAVAVSSGVLYALPGYDEKKLFLVGAADGNERGVSGALAEDALWGEVTWTGVTSPALDAGNIYFGVGSLEHVLTALDRGSLEAVWPGSPSLGGVAMRGTFSSPAVAAGTLCIGTADGRFMVFSSTGGTLQEIILTTSALSSPAVSNGMVYLGTQGGKLLAWRAARSAAVSAPAPYTIVSGTAEIKGYIANPALSGYTLQYGAGTAPLSWTTIISTSASAPLENAVLAQWDVSGLANGLYTLKLTAAETPAAVTANTASVVVRVNYPPQPPASLSASDVPSDGGYHIRLEWAASPTAGVAAYRIYRSTGAAYSLLASTGAAARSCIDAAAVTGTTFTYVVRSFDGWLESGDSQPASAFSVKDDPSGDNIAPAAVADLAGAQGSLGGRAALSWTAPGNDGEAGAASHYEIRYASYSASGWTDFALASLWKSSRPVSGSCGTPETEEVRGLFGGTTYYFRLKAFDFNGNGSPLSNTATAWAAIDYVPPQPPSSFTVVDTPGDHGGRLTLGWALSPDDGDGAGDVYGYKVYRSPVPGQYVSTAPYAVTAAGESGYLDTEATLDLKFYYAVAAFDSSNDSAHSAEAYGISADNWRFFDASRGGSVRLTDGMEISIPRNSISQNDNILVTRLDPVTYQPLFAVKANTGARPTNIVYKVEFEKSSTTLTGRAVVTLPYTDGETAGMSEENFRMYALSGSAWHLLNTSAVQPEANRVTAEVASLSTFRIMEYLPSGVLMTASAVYTYPNPAKGDAVTFKFLLSDKAGVSIDVYNVAGEKVAALSRGNCPAGVTSEIVWDIKNIASGVYVYKVKAESASGSKTVTKKLAVVH